MTKAMITLLASATAILELGENALLAEKIDAFNAVGEAVKATDVEAIALQEIVDAIKAEEKAEAKRLADEAKANETAEPKHYMHIRMIGNLFYHKADNYAKSYGTARECALEHNK